MSMPKAECDARIAKARETMRRQAIDGLLVTDPVNFYYFTGQKISVSMSGRPAILVLPLAGEPAVIDWSGPGVFARLYHRPYPNWIEDRRIYPEVPFTREERVDWGVKDVIHERGLANARLAIEMSEPKLGLTIMDFERLREDLSGVTWVDSGPVTWRDPALPGARRRSRFRSTDRSRRNGTGRQVPEGRYSLSRRRLPGERVPHGFHPPRRFRAADQSPA